MTYDELEQDFEKTCESQLCCNDCKFHDNNAACALVYGYEQGRAEAIKEFKEFLQSLAFGKRKGLVHWSDVENITKMMKEQKT